MSEHTPGPWIAEIQNDGSFEIWRGPLVICSRNRWDHNARQSKANARLLAVAPGLLDVFLAIDDWFHVNGGKGAVHTDVLGQHIEKGREIIRSALTS